MNTINNVISMEHSVTLHIETAIIDALSNRGGKWVSQYVVYNATDDVTLPNMSVMAVVNEMVNDNILEKSFHTTTDKIDRTFQLPMYRLVPNFDF